MAGMRSSAGGGRRLLSTCLPSVSAHSGTSWAVLTILVFLAVVLLLNLASEALLLRSLMHVVGLRSSPSSWNPPHFAEPRIYVVTVVHEASVSSFGSQNHGSGRSSLAMLHARGQHEAKGVNSNEMGALPGLLQLAQTLLLASSTTRTHWILIDDKVSRQSSDMHAAVAATLRWLDRQPDDNMLYTTYLSRDSDATLPHNLGLSYVRSLHPSPHSNASLILTSPACTYTPRLFQNAVSLVKPVGVFDFADGQGRHIVRWIGNTALEGPDTPGMQEDSAESRGHRASSQTSSRLRYEYMGTPMETMKRSSLVLPRFSYVIKVSFLRQKPSVEYPTLPSSYKGIDPVVTPDKSDVSFLADMGVTVSDLQFISDSDGLPMAWAA